MSKKASEKLRNEKLKAIIAMFEAADEEVLVTGSNEISIPCVDEEGEDSWIVVTVKVPTGSRDGDPYDGYGLKEEYEMKLAEKAEKAKAAEEKKAKALAKKQKEKELKAAAKAKAKEEGEG